MLLTFTESTTGQPVSINSDYIVAVFTAAEGDNAGKTVVGVINGSVVVDDSYLDVTGLIKAAS